MAQKNLFPFLSLSLDTAKKDMKNDSTPTCGMMILQIPLVCHREMHSFIPNTASFYPSICFLLCVSILYPIHGRLVCVAVYDKQGQSMPPFFGITSAA